MTEPPIWTGPLDASLRWRARELYFGRLFIGETLNRSHYAPPKWHWAALLMTTGEGVVISRHPTEQEAKDALVDAALKGLRDE